ncbi:cytochrome c [Guyparkeria hydrothermalis]|uniref:c-type cytochrome n=1 Tax=Guyparkeria TaxID=2035712 RepID=UPI0010AC71E1|nr:MULTISPECIES: cytochrome c [Guyparkeria]MCL7750396.1 cytochrome c [Guyparkeria hydrothermalis]TKA91088.1 cytochrome c [Guyparkeria sp. SB14A]
MSKLKTSKFGLGLAAGAMALGLSTAGIAAEHASGFNGIGKNITDKAIEPWDISVFYDGENLPKGSGTVEAGQEPYDTQCAMCHGAFGEGAEGYPKMAGDPMPQFITSLKQGLDGVGNRGVNNAWGHAPTLFDMIKRHMPFYAPGTMGVDESYAVTCYVLNLANIVDYEFTCSNETLADVKMPAADYYVTDTRPDTDNQRCMSDCYDYEPKVVGAAVTGVSE